MSTGFPGILNSQIAPLVQTGDSELRAIARAIGANQQSFLYDTNQTRAVETFTLQHLIGDSATYLSATVSSAMQSANPSIFRLAPMLRAETTRFKTQHYEFIAELAVETPAQAPPNYLEVQESEFEAGLTRHALAVTATVQELRTAKGQFFFMGKLIYLTIAFIEQAELKFFQAVVETPSVYARYAFLRNQWEIDLARVGRVKDEYWDILRRNPSGFFTLRDLVAGDFNSKNLRVTHVLMRTGIRSLIAASPMLNIYNLRGPGAAENNEMRADNIGNNLGGVEIITVRAYEYEKKDLRIDPLDRRTIIGAHYRMDPNMWPTCDYSKWCTAWMNIELYSVNDDVWQVFTPQQALRACGRFGPEGKLHPHHDDLLEHWKTYVDSGNRRTVPIRDNQYDMFFYTTTNVAGQTVVDKTCSDTWRSGRWTRPQWSAAPPALQTTCASSSA